jgi:hypothetical protein
VMRATSPAQPSMAGYPNRSHQHSRGGLAIWGENVSLFFRREDIFTPHQDIWDAFKLFEAPQDYITYLEQSSLRKECS